MMSLGPIPLFLVLVVMMVAASLLTGYVRTRWFGRPRRPWTGVAWAIVAAVLAYFLIQGLRHA